MFMARVLLLALAIFHVNAEFSNLRIIGGSDVKIPTYVVSIQHFGKHICGGVIYNKDYVITAAQCLDGKEHRAITIRQNTTTYDKGGNIRYISDIHVHPDYDSDLKLHDLAVIKVEELQEAKELITLTKKNVTAEETLTIYGWGVTRSDEEEFSNNLKKADVKVYDNTKCKYELGSLSINNNMVCTAIGAEGSNPCIGDQGGPLVKANELYGIISWNKKCNKGPTVHTSILPYTAWIKEVAK